MRLIELHKCLWCIIAVVLDKQNLVAIQRLQHPHHDHNMYHSNILVWSTSNSRTTIITTETFLITRLSVLARWLSATSA